MLETLRKAQPDFVIIMSARLVPEYGTIRTESRSCGLSDFANLSRLSILRQATCALRQAKACLRLIHARAAVRRSALAGHQIADGLSGAEQVHPALWFASLALTSPGEGEARKLVIHARRFPHGNLDWLIT
jgi:hypothetical protein